MTDADADAETTSDVAPEALPPKRLGLFGLIAAAALALDLLTKIVVVATVDDPVRVLGGLFYIVHTRNSGAAFSLGTGYTLVLTVVAVAVVAAILHWARRMRSASWAVGLGLILGGALGNLVDRFFRDPSPGRGHVVDWISFLADDGHVWPVFNVADSAVVCGALLAILLTLRGIEIDGSRAKK